MTPNEIIALLIRAATAVNDPDSLTTMERIALDDDLLCAAGWLMVATGALDDSVLPGDLKLIAE